jgi:hypothetical protein
MTVTSILLEQTYSDKNVLLTDVSNIWSLHVYLIHFKCIQYQNILFKMGLDLLESVTIYVLNITFQLSLRPQGAMPEQCSSLGLL